MSILDNEGHDPAGLGNTSETRMLAERPVLARIADLEAELTRWKGMYLRDTSKLTDQIDALAPFLAVWADRYQRDCGLNGFHPVHYDLLEKTGARMVDFKRATNAPALSETHEQLTEEKKA